MFHVGVVENRHDPLKLGRCQVRIVGLHTDDRTALPTKDLPWAYPVQPITSAGVSGIGQAPVGVVEGTWVCIAFRDKDQQQPLMMGTFGGIPMSDPQADPNNIEEIINKEDLSGTSDTNLDARAPDPLVASGLLGPVAKLIASVASESYAATQQGGGTTTNVTNLTIQEIMDKQATRELNNVGKYGITPTDLRNAITNKDIPTIQSMMPDGITAKEYIQTLSGQKKLQEIVTDTEVICDNCGWEWKIEDGGDDLYICHKCGHDNTPKDNQNKAWNLQEGMLSLSKYMIDNGMNIKPLPKIKMVKNDKQNASNLLGKTAFYNPTEKSITLFTLNRHPKDILRSFSHEMVNHMQNLEGRLNNIQTTNTNEDGDLPEIEEEAYKLGNMMLRNWEDSIKNV
jgi:hypothetical protein